MINKKYIYLYQGQAKLLSRYIDGFVSEERDMIILTYDEPIHNEIYFPNSTWAEGRNKLLEAALDKGTYEYYIFCDDDIEFERGGIALFEQNLSKYKPSVAVPIVPRTKRSVIGAFFKFQSFLVNDEQMIAFHNSVIEDGVVMPYFLKFDKIHWWATCQVQEILIQNFYRYEAIQFNDIEINNPCGQRYDASEVGREFRSAIRIWFGTQFYKDFLDIREKYKNNRLRLLSYLMVLYRTSRYFIRMKLGRTRRKIDASKIDKQLRENCELSVCIRKRLSELNVNSNGGI